MGTGTNKENQKSLKRKHSPSQSNPNVRLEYTSESETETQNDLSLKDQSYATCDSEVSESETQPKIPRFGLNDGCGNYEKKQCADRSGPLNAKCKSQNRRGTSERAGRRERPGRLAQRERNRRRRCYREQRQKRRHRIKRRQKRENSRDSSCSSIGSNDSPASTSKSNKAILEENPCNNSNSTTLKFELHKGNGNDNDNNLLSSVSKAEDFKFIKEFNNMYASSTVLETSTRKGLRPILIDAYDVGLAHGNYIKFSYEGFMICADYFRNRGHQVKIFLSRGLQTKVPKQVVNELILKEILVLTPSRCPGRTAYRITSRVSGFIVQHAVCTGALIVSNCDFGDLYDEQPTWQETIKNQVLTHTWPTKDIVMFPLDPLGRKGPNLKEFLEFSE